jgi:hypothetical protein
LESGIEKLSHRIYTQGKKFKYKLFDYFDFAHPQDLAALAVNMLSSKENSHMRKKIWTKEAFTLSHPSFP